MWSKYSREGNPRCGAKCSRLREALTPAVTSNDGDGMMEGCKPRLTTLRWLAASIVCTHAAHWSVT